MSPSQPDTPVEEQGTLDKEEVIELLGEDETKEVPEVTKAPAEDADEEEGAEEPDELKEIEEELAGPKEEDLELMTPVRRKEILKKYPALFKDFPYLEKAYYRDQQFTELLPTLDDARQAIDKAKILDQVENSVRKGDISQILQAAKNEDQNAFYRIADNYLPTLKQVDQQAYYHVISSVIKDTIVTMVREGRNLGDQGAPITAAANILNQFIFGSQTFTPYEPLAPQPRPEEDGREQQLKQREQQFVTNQFVTIRDDLQTRADNVLKATIDGHIDPKGTMTDYVKQHAAAEAFSTLDDLMSRDTRFRGLIDKLWERAFETGFNKESTDRIKSAYLSKAKTLLPAALKKARNEALRGTGRRVVEDVEEPRAPIRGGGSPQPSGKFKKASDIPRNMSTLDVLMKD